MEFHEYSSLYNLWKGELCLALRLDPEADAQQALSYITGLGGEIARFDEKTRQAFVSQLPLTWSCRFNYLREDTVEHKQCYYWKVLDENGCERGMLSAPPANVDEDEVVEPPTLVLYGRYDMKIVKSRAPQNEQEPFLITGVVYDRAYVRGQGSNVSSMEATSQASEMPETKGANTALPGGHLFSRQWPVAQNGSTALRLFGLHDAIERALTEYMRRNNLKRSEVFYFGWADGPEPFQAMAS